MQISGEAACYELTHLNLNCLQKISILPLALNELSGYVVANFVKWLC